MEISIGYCSICGGEVKVPQAYMSIDPPKPRCSKCGATKRVGPVIDMVPGPKLSPIEVASAFYKGLNEGLKPSK